MPCGQQSRVQKKSTKISGIGVTEALALWERKAGVRLSDSRPLATRRTWIGAAVCKTVAGRLSEFESHGRHLELEWRNRDTHSF